MRIACRLLRDGTTIVIFLKGSLVPSGKRIPARTGVIRMALKIGAPRHLRTVKHRAEHIQSLVEEWMNKIDTMITETEKDLACTSPTLLNATPRL